ncbi:MAG: hypothetical protein ACREUW_18805 [Burkholderiales bacterium]
MSSDVKADARIRELLADSLALWAVTGTVEAGASPLVAVIRTDGGAIAWIERPAADVPFRWTVRWRAAGEAPGGPREERPRPCASLVGLLKALRGAFGVERGAAVQVVPAPVNA